MGDSAAWFMSACGLDILEFTINWVVVSEVLREETGPDLAVKDHGCF
jgi:hypothetical protein